MTVKRIERKVLLFSALQENPLSANREDTATYSRLKREMQSTGLLELPLVLHDPETDTYRILAGHHRARAWQELGHDSIECDIVEGELTKEDEFNLVNNLNQIRGSVTVSELKRVIRHAELDATKLDVFKYPVARLLPGSKETDNRDSLMRKAKIRDMALKIAGEVAEVLLDDIDAAVVALRVEDTPVAILRIPLNKTSVRANVSILKPILERALTEWEAVAVTVADPESMIETDDDIGGI